MYMFSINFTFRGRKIINCPFFRLIVFSAQNRKTRDSTYAHLSNRQLNSLVKIDGEDLGGSVETKEKRKKKKKERKR